MGWQEKVASDEGARFESYAAELRALQRRNNAKTGNAAARTLHVKAHVGCVGTLVVNGTVAPPFNVGVFAEGGHQWPAYVRFSNGSARRQSDKAPDARGVAVKLVGVPGAKLIRGLEDKLTQDFLFVPTPSIPFRDPDEFVRFIRAAAKRGSPLALVGRLLGDFGLLRGVQVVRRLTQEPKVTSMVKHKFFTAAPIQMGDAAAKLALFPIAGAGPSASAAASVDDDNMLRDDLVHTLQHGTVEYSVRAQAFVDERTTPVEDASVTWPEATTPFVEVGRLVLPQQDVTTARGKEIEELVEKLSFDPWHAIEAHRPLGAIMRARAVAYRESVLERGAAAEPDSVLSIG